MENSKTYTRVECPQCGNMILEATSERNDGLCGICNNWEYPSSDRNLKKILVARSNIRCGNRLLFVVFLSIVLLIMLAVKSIKMEFTLFSIVIWVVISLYGFNLLKACVYLALDGYKRSKYTDEELFADLKKGYLRRVNRRMRFKL